MLKFLIFIGSIFVLALVSPIGKTIQDAVTENYTYASFNANLTSIGWFDAYMRSWWWIMPLAILLILIIIFFRRDEPQAFYPSAFQAPVSQRVPRQRKVKVTAQPKAKPPIFFGGK